MLLWHPGGVFVLLTDRVVGPVKYCGWGGVFRHVCDVPIGSNFNVVSFTL